MFWLLLAFLAGRQWEAVKRDVELMTAMREGFESVINEYEEGKKRERTNNPSTR